MIEPKLHKGLNELQKGVRTRDHNRRKRFEGVTVSDRTPTSPSRDPYHRDQSQIDAYREQAKRQFPDT